MAKKAAKVKKSAAKKKTAKGKAGIKKRANNERRPVEGKVRKGGRNPAPTTPKPKIKPAGQSPVKNKCPLCGDSVTAFVYSDDLEPAGVCRACDDKRLVDKGLMKGDLGIEYVPIDTIRLNPKNPRRNEETTEDIIRSINAFGVVWPILVRQNTNTIIAGNNRYRAFTEMGMKTIPVIFRTMDEIDADVLMVTDNKITEKTPWDFPKLADLFVEFDAMNADMDLTGFAEHEIKAIIYGPTGDGNEWEGMPEFDQQDKTAYRSIIVHFKGEEGIEAFRGLINQTITDKTKSLWYPEAVIETYMDKEYESKP